ncbi:unnamed protein product, partial [Eruca vesicaria subsp. sativa]|nr:unnamed protein product [Eruca vesicaria subsp. sativa]
IQKVKMEKVKTEVASGSSMRRRNSSRRFCICGFPASITQGWTDRNPCRQFYGCLHFPSGCNYFSWFDEDDVIEQITQTISKMKSNFENKETVDEKNEDEIGREFEEIYL